MDVLIIIGVVIFLIIVFKTPSNGSNTKRRRRYTNRNTKRLPWFDTRRKRR